MSEEQAVVEEPVTPSEQAKPKRRAPNQLESRVKSLEEDNKKMKELLHAMKTAIGLPESILPKL